MASADDFDPGSYIIPMDLDYQDEGMLRAYGLVYDLLRAGVPVRWVIRDGKGYGESDFTATSIDVATGAPVGEHDYRGGPFVVDAADAAEAADIIADWQVTYPETAVHEATALFTADVSRYLVVAPTIAMVADGNEDIARGYMQAAGIPDSTLSLDWADDSPDMLDVAELAGPTEASHTDGLLFDEDGDPVYCQLMSMHWGVNDAENDPEVVAEVRAYLGNPVHFFAECQAVNAFENSVHGLFLTPNGFEIGNRPDEVDYHHMDSPFGQLDGVYETVGGSEPAYTLPPGDTYKAGDITMLTEADTPEGVNDVWMTGFLDGACPPDQHECGTVGKVSYLGGHRYDTDMPVSANGQAHGVRMFLNSLFEAPCATVEGLPAVAVAVGGPAQTLVPTVTLAVTYANTDFVTALDGMIVDTLPANVTFVSASDGGMYADGQVTWDVGNLGPEESGDLTIEVELPEYGTYEHSAVLHYRVGLNDMMLASNVAQTIYGEDFGTSGGLDDTAGSASGGGGSGVADSGTGGADATAGTAGTADTGATSVGLTAGDEGGTTGCGCRSGTGHDDPPWLMMLGGLVLLGTRRRRRLTGVGATALGLLASGGGCSGLSEEVEETAGSTTFGLTSDTAPTADEETGEKLDAQPATDVPFNPTSGCQKIDFLFVIDSSESMKSHQQNLIDSFPGFVTAIEGAVLADDWHVMVVDTDGQWNGSDCANACNTLGSCPGEPAFDCATPPPALCDITIGSGMVAPYGEGATNQDCGLGGERFIDASAPDLSATFGCVAQVGVDGSSQEHTAEALVRSLSPELRDPGACNAGFLRDDAILVVTLITDEPDDVSPDDPPAWYDAVVAAKNGDDTAVVVLGLLPDADGAEAPVCDDPVAAPRLTELLAAFPASTRGSVCAPDYSPFLVSAVEVIADTCDGFEPPA